MGYKMGEGGCVISMLQYVDDTIFLGESNEDNVFIIKTILRMFELAFWVEGKLLELFWSNWSGWWSGG